MRFDAIELVRGTGEFIVNFVVICDSCRCREFGEGMEEQPFLADLGSFGWALGETDICPECRNNTTQRKRVLKHDTADRWTRCYFRCKNSQQTFRQAESLFKRDNGYWPPHDLPYMPKRAVDWAQKCREVSEDDLISPAPRSPPKALPQETQQGSLF